MLAISCGFDAAYITCCPLKGIRELQKPHSRHTGSEETACTGQNKEAHRPNKPIAAMARFKLASYASQDKVEPNSPEERKNQPEYGIIHSTSNIRFLDIERGGTRGQKALWLLPFRIKSLTRAAEVPSAWLTLRRTAKS